MNFKGYVNKTFAYTMLVALSFLSSVIVHADTLPSVKVGTLSFGTINWEMDTLKHHGFDTKHGINVETVKLTSKNAAAIALQSKAVDVILTDLFWVIKQTGKFQIYPTHKLTGGIYTKNREQAFESLKSLGVAGGANDKNLLVLKAYLAAHKRSLPEQIKYAAPPLLNELLKKQQLDATINFWHYNARLDANGFHNILPTQNMLESLGFKDNVPLLGWVFSRDYGQESAQHLTAFINASKDAKQLLMSQPSEWDRIRPLMRAENNEEFAALKAHYSTTLLLEYDMSVNTSAKKIFDLVKTVPEQTIFTGKDTFPDDVFFSLSNSTTIMEKGSE